MFVPAYVHAERTDYREYRCSGLYISEMKSRRLLFILLLDYLELLGLRYTVLSVQLTAVGMDTPYA